MKFVDEAEIVAEAGRGGSGAEGAGLQYPDPAGEFGPREDRSGAGEGGF